MKTKTKIIIGFVIEVFSFLQTGFLIALGSYLAILTFIFAMFIAQYTGRQIEINALENYEKTNTKRIDVA